jgi:hypothetical protein
VDRTRTGPSKGGAAEFRTRTTQVADPREVRKDVRTMAASLTTEEESGMSRGSWHPHNGYYAGDFQQEAALSPGNANLINRPF